MRMDEAGGKERASVTSVLGAWKARPHAEDNPVSGDLFRLRSIEAKRAPQ